MLYDRLLMRCVSSSSTHAGRPTSFFLLENNSPLNRFLLGTLSTLEYSSHFHFGAPTKNAAGDIEARGLVWMHVLTVLGFMPRTGIAGTFGCRTDICYNMGQPQQPHTNCKKPAAKDHIRHDSFI